MHSLESLLQKCTSLPRIKQLQAHLLVTGQFQSTNACTRLVKLCAISPSGDLSFATRVFHRILRPSMNDFNAILKGIAQSPEPTGAVSWYRSMLHGSRRVDAISCSFTLKACAHALAISEGMQLHSQVVRFGFCADVLLRTTLLDMYAKGGDLDSAEKVFDEMPVRDIASWNALISGLAQGHRPTEAISLYKRMKEEGLKPNEVTVIGALSACSQLGATREGGRVHDYITEEKLD